MYISMVILNLNFYLQHNENAHSAFCGKPRTDQQKIKNTILHISKHSSVHIYSKYARYTHEQQHNIAS